MNKNENLMAMHLIDDAIIENEETECWAWQKSKRKGYGYMKFRGKWFFPAHRVSFIVYKGEIPEGLFVCHKCDNPSCVNPDHLYAGTPKQNMQDKMERGRFFNGHSAKTHCVNGHEFTEENTHWRKSGSKTSTPWRSCKICAAERGKKWRETHPYVKPQTPRYIKKKDREAKNTYQPLLLPWEMEGFKGFN